MATKFYNVEKAAELLGVSPAEINAMRERQQLHGYRDGADWKFKAEEVERLAQESAETASEEDVLLSEVEFGESDPGASGTVIGPPPKSVTDAVGSAVSGFEDLDLTVADSQLDMAVDSAGSGGSTVDLSGEGLDDDDLVLGGSGAGSDITLGGDSGISLVDPTDSGLSLEGPLDLGGGSRESLELGSGSLDIGGLDVETPGSGGRKSSLNIGGGSGKLLELGDDDDLLSLAEASSLGLAPASAIASSKSEDDFMLTPMDEGGAEDDDSGSQIIALDAEEGGSSGDLGPMLDSSIGGALGVAVLEQASAASVSPLAGVQDFGAHPQAAGAAVAVAAPEGDYSTWNIVSLALCTIVLAVIGMFLCDLMRNMWSWNGAIPVNSSLMDLILGR